MSGRAAIRAVFGILVVSGLLVGCWAAFAPHSFFVSFPGGGHAWAATDGPYNEHLVRDVGGLNLALVAVSACAFVWLTRPLAIAAALAWVVYSVPHFAYHAANTQAVTSGDRVPELVSLAIPIVLGVALLVAARTPSTWSRAVAGRIPAPADG
jgi:hypothetical protein